MPYTTSSTVKLFYETSGPATGDPLVLIHGASAQMIAWHPDFVAALEQAGFLVIRFDNRDVGLSQRFDGASSAYDVSDMSDDVTRLLDHLRITSAHIVGQSLGGVIAQQFVLDHPERASSVCLIYTAHSFEHLIQDEEAIRLASEPPATDREHRIAQYIAAERVSGLDELSDDYVRALAERVVDRAWDPAGAARQMEAVQRSAPHPERLREVAIPTALIHGRRDRRVSFHASLEMSRLIPDSEVHIFADMGHQVRPSNWIDIIRMLRRNVTRSR